MMKKAAKLLVSVTLAVVMLIGFISAIPVSADDQEIQTRTVMLYMVGSNIESDWECGTFNLHQAMEADYNEHLNFIVMTGGSEKWWTEAEYLDGAEEIDPEHDQIWELRGRKEDEEHGVMKLVEPTGIEGFEKADMSLPKTLTAFCDYCYENYPTDQYDLILWDHGGGFAVGFGVDDRFPETFLMTSTQMVSAFENTRMNADGKKFEIIDFDACEMGGAEMIAVLAPYTDFMVVSPESEPGYGQEYTSWLNAVREDPGMDGFELGKHIVDGFKVFYDAYEIDYATLSVIDTNRFTERLMPKLIELDDILLCEAKTVGELNGRYNFYDELYSLMTVYRYSGGEKSLIDLGNLVGGLSSPQSEMDNADNPEIEALTNKYTEAALQILSILGDIDGSGDDVIYAKESELTCQTVDGYYIRGLDGEFISAGEDGFITVDPTGLSIQFGDGNLSYAYYYFKEIRSIIPVLKDAATLEFLKKQALSVAYYTLIKKIGSIVSDLSVTSEDTVTWDDVYERIEQNTSFYYKKGIPYLLEWIAEYDEDFDTKDDVIGYFSHIVEQQASEAITTDKVDVKKLIDKDGNSDFYMVTVKGASAQSLMKVSGHSWLEAKNYENEVFSLILQNDYNGMTAEEAFPYGIGLFSEDYEGALDFNRYYDNYYETIADAYRSIYSSDTSVWIVPNVEAYCLVLIDSEGNEHPAQLSYTGRAKDRALVPIKLYFENGNYRDAYLSISFDGSEWKVNGLTLSFDDDRSFYPMDHEAFIGAKYTTDGYVYNLDDLLELMPVSQLCEIDITKEHWGITFEWKKVDDLDYIGDVGYLYRISDLYDYNFDISDLIDAANEAALNGDVAYTIDCVDFSVAEAVYNGEAQTPKITATLNGKELEEGVDYKVLYDGEAGPGEAAAIVIGLRNLYGTTYIPYTVEEPEEPLTVKVDGTEIGENDYTVDEEGNITLTDAFVKTLAAGEHTLTVVKGADETTVGFTVEGEDPGETGNPPTGDSITLTAATILISLCAALSVLLKRKKEY